VREEGRSRGRDVERYVIQKGGCENVGRGVFGFGSQLVNVKGDCKWSGTQLDPGRG
jgi:hypothetical protein